MPETKGLTLEKLDIKCLTMEKYLQNLLVCFGGALYDVFNCSEIGGPLNVTATCIFRH
jgi:hypothetical protein